MIGYQHIAFLKQIIKRIGVFVYRIAINKYLNIYKIHHKLVYLAKQQPESENYLCMNFDSKHNPFKMLLFRPGYMEDKLAEYETYEPELTLLLSFFMKTDGVFLDIGANIGFYTLFIASSFENSQSIAFEPHRLIYQQLNQNIKLNENLSNIVTWDVAISNYCGEIDFYMQKESAFHRALSSTIYNCDLANNPQMVEKVQVKVTTIDNCIDNDIKPKVSIIKIDTQGNEYQVITGALNTIAVSHPVIIFEFEVRYHENPEEYFHKILAIIPEYKVFLIRKDASFQKFNISEICKIKSFGGDFICLPPEIIL